MESGAYPHGRCVPWHIGTGNRRQICDFEVQPSPHDEMPRWVQERPPQFQTTCSDTNRSRVNACSEPCPQYQQMTHSSSQQLQPCLKRQQPQSCAQQFQPCLQSYPQLQRQPQPNLPQQERLRQLFGDEMLLSDFDRMNGMERRFYIPPEFREMRNPHQVKAVVERDARASTSKKRECRSMCMPKGMGMIDPNCQGEDYRVKSGYQPSRPGDAVDRSFDPCNKWKPFRDGTSEGHKAAHWQFGKDREPSEGKLTASASASKCKRNGCPETETTIGNRSVYPKLGGMVPGYGGHVPGFERCKFGKTYGRETAEVLKKVKSNEKIPKSYTMAEWRSKCYNKEVNC